MPLPTRLDGRVALVTGASRGIGRAIALALAEQGAKVVVNYVSRAGDAGAVVDTIKANGGTAVAVRADVSAGPEVDAMIAGVAAQLGPVDILVNNAGIVLRRGIGKALLRHLARRCQADGFARLEWQVLDWNAPSIAFYKSLGAVPVDDWTVFRLTDDALKKLAE